MCRRINLQVDEKSIETFIAIGLMMMPIQRHIHDAMWHSLGSHTDGVFIARAGESSADASIAPGRYTKAK
jgi:hypothetical protein